MPLDQRNIILTGFMGTGKTTVGRLLATRLGREFVDTDAKIEVANGRSVADIFTEQGETAFRALEQAVARDLAAQSGLVIATGGRLMLDPDNVRALAPNSRIFCLTASPEAILARVDQDGGEQRPLLAGPDPRARIAELLAARARYYRRFPQVPTGERAPEAVVEALLARLEAPPETVMLTHPDGGQAPFIMGEGLLASARILAGIDGPMALITDTTVGHLYAPLLGDIATSVMLPDAFRLTRIAELAPLYEQLLAGGGDRQTTLVAMGGRAIGQTAAFVAATFMRGVSYVCCPTTPGHMIGSSRGGVPPATLFGVRARPAAVIADLATLQTHQRRNGPTPHEREHLAAAIRHNLAGVPPAS